MSSAANFRRRFKGCIHLVETVIHNCSHTAFWFDSFFVDSCISCLTTTFMKAMFVLVGEVVDLLDWVSSSTDNFQALKAFTHLKMLCIKIAWVIYTTQFMKYLLSVFIKPDTVFKITMNFTLNYHLTFTSKLASVYYGMYFNLKLLGHFKKKCAENKQISLVRGPLGRITTSAKSVQLFKYCINKWNICGSRKFCQRGSNSDNGFFFFFKLMRS